MGLEPRIALHVDRPRGKEPPVVQIPQPGGEAEAQEIEERKDDLGGPGGIRGMLPDRQFRFVIAEFVEDIRGVPHGDRDEFGAVLRELI